MSRKNFIVRGGGDFSALYNEFNKAQKKMNVFQKGMSGALKTVAGLFGGLAIGTLAKDFADTAMRTETLEVAMRSVARASGYATDELNKAKDAIRDKGIAEQESMQILTRFMQSQLDVAKASDLARVAQNAAVIANVNSSDAAEQMTEAIAKQRPQLLSAFGMTKNLNVILSEYGDTLGKTANELTEAERKQAMLNYILQEGQKIAGTYEASMGAVGKQIGSLPRLWQDLQNALATPLMLPGISTAVQAITSALQYATAWAETNAITLQMWGQIASGYIGMAVNTIQSMISALANNWSWIKYVIGAWLAYRVAIFAVAQGTQILGNIMNVFRIGQAALKGELASSAGVLGLLSQAVGIYRVQMALAPVATGMFTGALLKLRTALYAVHAALGPIGWAILAISGVVAGGMALWGKYTGSVNKANQAKINTGSAAASAKEAVESQNKTLSSANKALNDMNKNAGKAGSSQKKLGKDVKKAAKEAKGSIAGFDEINTLQQNMADTDMGDLDGLGGIGGVGSGVSAPEVSIPDFGDAGGMGGIGDMGIGDMMNDLELAKPTLKGFWKWIKQGTKDLWKKVKEYWNAFKEWVKGWEIWDAVKEKWNSFKEWASPYWESVKEKWNQFKDWVSEKFSNLWEGIKNKWNSFKEWASEMWAGTKKKWNGFKDWVSDGFSKLWDKTKATWNTFTTWASNMWETTKKKWNDFKENTKRIFEDMWTSIKTTFSSTKTWFGDTFGGAWEKIKEIFSLTNIRSHFSTVLNTIKSVFSSIPTWFETKFSDAWTKVKNVFSKGGKIFTGIKDGIASTFKTIVNGLIGGINRIIRVPFNAINGTLNKIRNVSIMGITPFSGFISHNAISTPQIPRLAKGGITNGEMLAVVGDNPGGREVVSPLDTLQDMLVNAVGTAMSSNNGENNQGDTNAEIVLRIGESEFGRASVKAINKLTRQTGRTVLEI